MITLHRGPVVWSASQGAGSSLSRLARRHGLVSTWTADMAVQEGQEELQDPVRNLLVEEVTSARQDPQGDVRQTIHRRMDVGHRDPTVPIPGHHQARDVDLTEATGHGVGIPSGHEPEHGTDVGWIAHETTIELHGRRRHL